MAYGGGNGAYNSAGGTGGTPDGQYDGGGNGGDGGAAANYSPSGNIFHAGGGGGAGGYGSDGGDGGSSNDQVYMEKEPMVQQEQGFQVLGVVLEMLLWLVVVDHLLQMQKDKLGVQEEDMLMVVPISMLLTKSMVMHPLVVRMEEVVVLKVLQ